MLLLLVLHVCVLTIPRDILDLIPQVAVNLNMAQWVVGLVAGVRGASPCVHAILATAIQHPHRVSVAACPRSCSFGCLGQAWVADGVAAQLAAGAMVCKRLLW